MYPIIRLAILALIVAATAPHAHAACSGATILAGLHDAYRATLDERGAVQRSSAISFLLAVNDTNFEVFAQSLARSEPNVSTKRLLDVLTDGAELATATLERRDVDVDPIAHRGNIRWLAATIVRANCNGIEATTTRQRRHAGASNGARPASPAISGEQAETARFSTLALIALGGLIVAFGLHRLRNSFVMRRRRAERLPRTSISLPLKAEYAFPDGEVRRLDVIGADISRGGMKINWCDPPSVGTSVKLEFPTGVRDCRIAWSNSFYAGVIFETQLPGSELASLLEAGQHVHHATKEKRRRNRRRPVADPKWIRPRP